MKAIVQRVKEAKVLVAGEIIGAIGRGALIFLAVEKTDTEADVEAMVKKISFLRMFPSPEGGRMELANFEVNGEYLVVSQFTLAADLSKGNRPSFDNAAPPELAEKLYEFFVQKLKVGPCRVATGKFRAMMDVPLVNDGPVTFIL
jgi:D-tyrosyl-tRNA(Tyr) deacylase